MCFRTRFFGTKHIIFRFLRGRKCKCCLKVIFKTTHHYLSFHQGRSSHRRLCSGRGRCSLGDRRIITVVLWRHDPEQPNLFVLQTYHRAEAFLGQLRKRCGPPVTLHCQHSIGKHPPEADEPLISFYGLCCFPFEESKRD